MYDDIPRVQWRSLLKEEMGWFHLNHKSSCPIVKLHPLISMMIASLPVIPPSNSDVSQSAEKSSEGVQRKTASRAYQKLAEWTDVQRM